MFDENRIRFVKETTMHQHTFKDTMNMVCKRFPSGKGSLRQIQER